MDKAPSPHPTVEFDSASNPQCKQGQMEGLRQLRAGMYLYHITKDRSLVSGDPAPRACQRACLVHHCVPHLPRAD